MAGGSLTSDQRTLRQVADPNQFLIGSGSINPDFLDTPAFARTLAEQFNSVSPENELKFSLIEPQQDVFDFAPIDELVAFAQTHGMAVKGHGLISGDYNPGWLTRSTNTAAAVRAATRNHVNTVMGRYAGEVDRWDVATEVLSTFGGTGLADNFWYRKLGAAYLDQVFHMAHDADPNAKLFLNESLVEHHPVKARELYDLVEGMVDRGVPIHGVGVEAHATVIGPPAGAIAQIVKAHQALGLEVAITEADVHVTDAALARLGIPGTADEVQGRIYGAIVDEALAAGVTDISFWGFTDDKQTYTWLPGARPTMFDASYRPKPAYFAVHAALSRHLNGAPPSATMERA